MKSKFLLAAWLVLVGAIVFMTVYFIGNDPGATDGGGMTAQLPPQPVPDVVKPDRVDLNTTNPQNPSTAKRLVPRVRGRVVAQDGTAVAGAELRVTIPAPTTATPATARDEDIRFISECIYIDPLDWDQPRPLRQFIENLREAADRRGSAQPVAAGTSDGEGGFDIELPRGLGLGPFRVQAESAMGKATVGGVRAGVEIEITVGPVAACSGHVYTGNENIGIPGATVVLDDGESRFVGSTDDEGAFRIEGVTPGRYAVSAGADGHPPILSLPMVVASGEDLAIRLPRGTLLRVIAEFTPDDGPDRPQPNAAIVVMEQDTYTYVLGTTDANGIAEFHGMPPGSYLVNGRAEGVSSFGEELAEVTGQQLLVEASVSFEPTVDTPLTVIDEAGNPVEGMVWYTANADEVYDALRSNKLPGATDGRGRYTFAFEFDGSRAQIYGFKKGFAMLRAYPDDNTEGAPLTLIARKGLRLHGTVRTPDGTPIPNALVLIDVVPSDPNDIEDFEIHVRSGPDGKYDFPFVPRGEIWLSAELETEDAWSDDLDVELIDGKTDYQKDIELELE